jgi:hypothetical protein
MLFRLTKSPVGAFKACPEKTNYCKQAAEPSVTNLTNYYRTFGVYLNDYSV